MQFDVIMDLEFPLLRRLLKKAVAIKAENMTLRVWVKDDMSRIDYCVNDFMKLDRTMVTADSTARRANKASRRREARDCH